MIKKLAVDWEDLLKIDELSIYSGNYEKKPLNIHKKFFQTILRMKMVVQYFSNLLIKNKSNIISSLNSNEVSGPKSIYLVGYNFFRKMKFPSNWQISSTSFMTRVFPSILKTPKVSPVFKKDSKLD